MEFPEQVATFLELSGYGTVAEDIFCDKVGSADLDSYILVSETLPFDKSQTDQMNAADFNYQILVVDKSSATARVKAREILQLFLHDHSQNAPLANTRLVDGENQVVYTKVQGGPIYLGRDLSKRSKYGVNITIRFVY